MISYAFTKHADRQLRKFSTPAQIFIIKKIEYYISTGDPLHYADSVENEQGRVYRFRAGDYRIIFDWKQNSILITKVAVRAKAY